MARGLRRQVAQGSAEYPARQGGETVFASQARAEAENKGLPESFCYFRNPRPWIKADVFSLFGTPNGNTNHKEDLHVKISTWQLDCRRCGPGNFSRTGQDRAPSESWAGEANADYSGRTNDWPDHRRGRPRRLRGRRKGCTHLPADRRRHQGTAAQHRGSPGWARGARSAGKDWLVLREHAARRGAYRPRQADVHGGRDWHLRQRRD